jgi:hypothetical protein
LADFLDSSPLKPFGQMNRNLVGSIYGKSSVAIADLLISKKIFSSDIALPNESKLGRMHQHTQFDLLFAGRHVASLRYILS